MKRRFEPARIHSAKVERAVPSTLIDHLNAMVSETAILKLSTHGNKMEPAKPLEMISIR
jgi:hypothetical protein